MSTHDSIIFTKTNMFDCSQQVFTLYNLFLCICSICVSSRLFVHAWVGPLCNCHDFKQKANWDGFKYQDTLMWKTAVLTTFKSVNVILILNLNIKDDRSVVTQNN